VAGGEQCCHVDGADWRALECDSGLGGGAGYFARGPRGVGATVPGVLRGLCDGTRADAEVLATSLLFATCLLSIAAVVRWKAL